MLISASRRTDIPAFYSKWLLNRLRERYVLVRNPFNPHQVARVSLDPRSVDGLIFWTKNPASLLPHLDEIDRLGHLYIFQFTLNAYGHHLEPHIPPLAERLAVFRSLAGQIGRERVLWRFDPILFTHSHGPEAVLREFAVLAEQLRSFTRQCTISFLSLYAKCKRNLQGVELLHLDHKEKIDFIHQLVAIAEDNDLRLRACCDSFLHRQCGIEAARCIDDGLLTALLGRSVRFRKASGQRVGCGCAASVDIGAYNTCPHGCRYCYATVSARAVTASRNSHDPHAPLLTGVLNGQETITERKILASHASQRCLF